MDGRRVWKRISRGFVRKRGRHDLVVLVGSKAAQVSDPAPQSLTFRGLYGISSPRIISPASTTLLPSLFCHAINVRALVPKGPSRHDKSLGRPLARSLSRAPGRFKNIRAPVRMCAARVFAPGSYMLLEIALPDVWQSKRVERFDRYNILLLFNNVLLFDSLISIRKAFTNISARHKG